MPITKRDWERSLKSKKTNPLEIGMEFLEYLNDNPGSTYNDIANEFGMSKARICQMDAFVKKLPIEITDYLMNTYEPGVLKHFTERRLRPLTLLASDDDKLRKFDEMKDALYILIDMQIDDDKITDIN